MHSPPPTQLVAKFSCETLRHDEEAARVLARGELDLATEALLRDVLDALRADGVRDIILDLGALDFMDSSGLRCILEYDTAGRQDGFSLALVPGSPEIQRVFELTQTVSRLSFIVP